jgi:hypothetical protein
MASLGQPSQMVSRIITLLISAKKHPESHASLVGGLRLMSVSIGQ